MRMALAPITATGRFARAQDLRSLVDRAAFGTAHGTAPGSTGEAFGRRRERDVLRKIEMDRALRFASWRAATRRLRPLRCCPAAE